MNRVGIALLLLLIVVNSGVSQAPVTIHNGFLNAQDYLEMNADKQQYFSMGIMDGILLAPLFGAPDKEPKLIAFSACIEGMSQKQVAAIIEKFVRDHPERWHQQLNAATFAAVKEACRL